MIKTLAEKHPEGYKNLKRIGLPCIAEMMNHFARPVDIDNALGLNACAAHWIAGRNGASSKSERLAAEWLEKQHTPMPPMPPIPPKSTDGVFMVVCPADKTAKVTRVLEIMGCELVEI